MHLAGMPGRRGAQGGARAVKKSIIGSPGFGRRRRLLSLRMCVILLSLAILLPGGAAAGGEQIPGGSRSIHLPAQVRPGRTMTYRELVVMQILGLPGSDGTAVVRMEAELDVVSGQRDGRGNIPVEITFSRVDFRSNMELKEDPAQLQGSKLQMKISPEGRILGYPGAAAGLEAADIGTLEAAVVSGGLGSSALGVLERGGLLRVIARELPPDPLKVGESWQEQAHKVVQTSLGPVELQVDTTHSLIAIEQRNGAEIAQLNTSSTGQAGGSFPAGQGRQLEILVRQNGQGVAAFDMIRGILLKDVDTIGQVITSRVESEGAAEGPAVFAMQVEASTTLELVSMEDADY